MSKDEYKGISFGWIIWLQWITHLCQFLTKTKIYNYVEDNNHIPTTTQSIFEEKDDKYRAADGTPGVEAVDSESEAESEPHYIHMTRKLSEDGAIRWALFGTIHTALIVAYLFSSGQEIIYGLYIPFDYATTAALASFYFYFRRSDDRYHKQVE